MKASTLLARLVAAGVAMTMGVVAEAADVEKAHIIQTIIVAKFVKEGYGPAGEQVVLWNPTKEERDNSEFRIGTTIASDILDKRKAGLTLYGAAQTYDRENIILLYAKSEQTKYTDLEEASNDAEMIRKYYDRGSVLQSCSSLYGDKTYRLYAFAPKEQSDDKAFLIAEPNPYSTNEQRASFWDELRVFKVKRRQYIKEDDAKYREVPLRPEANYGMRALRNCNGLWHAFFSSKPEFVGDNKLVFVEDLADLLKQVEGYRKDGYFLIDVAKGLKDGTILSPSVWVGVFSANPRYKTDIRIEYLTEIGDEFQYVFNKNQADGFLLESISTGSRGILNGQNSALVKAVTEQIRSDMLDMK